MSIDVILFIEARVGYFFNFRHYVNIFEVDLPASVHNVAGTVIQVLILPGNLQFTFVLTGRINFLELAH
jgi:hypothetical protein